SDLAGEMEAAAASLWSDPDDDHNTPESSIAEESDLAGEMEAAVASLWSDPEDNHNTPESSIAEESDLAGEMEAAASLWSDPDDDHNTPESGIADEGILHPWDDQETTTPPPLPDITEDILNNVADAAEPIPDEIVSSPPEEKDIFADNVAFLEKSSEESQTNTRTPEIDLDGECSIVLHPRNAEWAYVTWYIEESCQKILQNNGISQLYLRLYDVTDIDLSYQTRQLLQQYELNSEIERYIPIPQSDRDYVAEIGYVTTGERWVTIAASSRVRVFATPQEDTTVDPINLDGERSISLQPRNAEWAYVTWYIEESCQKILQNNSISQLYLRLYDVTDIDLSYQTPQLLQQYELEPGIEEKYISIPQSDRDYITEIGYVIPGERWVIIARSPRVRVFATSLGDTTASPLINLDGEQSIVLKPRNAEWAYATWYLDQNCQETLENNGISQLGLRLYDVTDIDLSYQTPQVVQEYQLEPRIEEKYIGIPQSDHDYIAEIGYITIGERWVRIARSNRIRVFSTPLKDTTAENLDLEETTFIELPQTNHPSNVVLKSRTPKWAYATWYISITDKQILEKKNISRLYLRLYNVTDIDLSYQTPQLVQQYECDDITRDRYVAISATDQDYMAELGYMNEANSWEMISRSETIRVFNRPQTDFWFVADAELIIHGSTEPGATVNVAGKPIKIKSDGTFHLRIPFSDNSINYVMTAIAANGEDSQSIHKQFSQENSAE
ncbi:DUF4912 domain-containing protein, partial [Nodularia harveyana UHCC-0300]